MPKLRLKYLNEQDPWLLAEDGPDVDFFFSQIWLSSFVNEFRWPGGRAYKKILCLYKGYHLWFYYGEKDSKEVGDHLVQKFIKSPKFAKEVNKKIVQWSNKLRKYAETLPETKLEKYSNQKLWHLYQKHDVLHTKYYQWGWIPVAADMFHANLTEKLKGYLQTLNVEEEKLNEYLVLLTQPCQKSLIQIEQEEFLKIAAKIQKDPAERELFEALWQNFKEQEVAAFGFKTHSKQYEKMFARKTRELEGKIKPHIYKLIEKHYQKYFYVNHLWVGRCYPFEYYLKELVRLVGQGVVANQKLRKINRKFQATLKKRKKLLRTLKVKEPYLTLFNAFGDFMVTKIYRRFSQIYAIYKMEFILEEIARRLRLTLKEVRFMLPPEVRRALFKGQLSRQEIKERTRFCVYFAEKKKEVIFIGKKAKALAKGVARRVEKVTEIKGQTGCLGKAQGKVKIIIRPADMPKMQKGDVLVSIATNPDIVPAMKKAAAIVTEQGGVTCHAAIISRELGIPCLIGTKIATRVLKDGDMVEVDATKGIVRKL